MNPNLGATKVRTLVTMAMTKNPGRRRLMEDTMAAEIRRVAPGVESTPSYTVLSDADIANEARVQERVERAGYDAAIVMRITDVQRQDVYVPGSAVVAPVYYRTFWGYYRHWIPIAYEPGYIEHDRDVHVETEMYSMRTGELAYSALSATLNPSSPASLAKEVGHVVAEDLRSKGVLQ
jgi:hypothetical protein